MWWRSRLAELRTTLTGVDPGLIRLRLAGIAIASMLLACTVMSAVRALTGQPFTVVLMAAALAVISNLAVNEPDPARLRLTTVLMAVPAAASVAAGTLLAAHQVVTDTVFVAVMVLGVYVRRFGPRGSALGMAAVMGYFFAQFLHVGVAELPWLLAAAGVGIGSTTLLRGWLLAERRERTLARLTRAFRAHLYGLVEAVVDLLAARPGAIEHELRDLARRRTRLNETALLVADTLEQRRDDRGDARADESLELRIMDAELAAERLAVSSRRLVQDSDQPTAQTRRSLLDGLRALGAASATGTRPDRVPVLLDAADRSVRSLVTDADGPGDRAQRVAFAVARLAEALGAADGDPRGFRRGPDAPEPDDAPAPPADVDEPAGLRTTTRQAIQVGVATSLAIVLGELLSPARWYWAVIAAFVVFAGTTSRGDVLARGSQRVVGTIGGVAAGMGLAVLVSGVPAAALVLLFGCVFLALYQVRVSQALMAFWVTAVLALLYGLIGQFSVETLLVRVEETAVGAGLGMLTGYLVLPKSTRDAFDEALDEMVETTDAVLTTTVAAILGRPVTASPVELAREMDEALGELRLRAKPLENPVLRRRGRYSYQRALRVLTAVDHYARRLARVSDGVRAPDWAPTLEPAERRVRANIAGLRLVLAHREGADVCSAEEVVDAAETHAARDADPRRRAELLTVARLFRRIDQIVVAFAVDLGAGPPRAERETV